MSRPPVRTLALMLSTLLFAACSEDTTPTEPVTTGDLSAVETSHPWIPNHWTPRAPLKGPNGGIAGAVVNNAAGQPIFYALGGAESFSQGSGFPVQAYNLATNVWVIRNSRVNLFRTNGAGKVGGTLYFSGGADRFDENLRLFHWLYAYDVARDRLIQKADPPKATADGVTGVINGKLYVLPGTCSGDFWPNSHYCEHEPFRELWRYDPVANVWTTLASAPHFHANGAGGVINGKFYVAGGGAGDSNGPSALDSGNAYLDVYDPLSNQWKTLVPMPASRRSATGAVLAGKFWVIGSNGSNRLTYAYDPLTNKWATRASLPTGGASDVAAQINDRQGQAHILVVGGGTYEKPAPSELYTP
jgi:hypothetical protein